jgi:hypothetical protein
MKRILKFLACITAALIVAAVSLSMYLDSFYWEKKSSLVSPDGSITINEYYNMSDGDRHAPYGTYLFMQPSFSPMPAYKSHVVFAGYCKNSINYAWVSNKEVNITCLSEESGNVRTHSIRAFGVSINVSSKNS